MVKRNPHIAKLHSSYLFPEINKRKNALLSKNPAAKIISLSIGDTTEPIPPFITEGLVKASLGLGNPAHYRGYGPEQGILELRQKIAQNFYGEKISPDEVFISDGSKCDIGRLQTLFGPHAVIAVQDPSYPAYVDTSVASGQTGIFDQSKGQYARIVYLPCLPENGFFPKLTEDFDLLYFCSPNNPTGAVATKEQLKQLVDYVRTKKAILVFDAAYSSYIRDPNLPKSIYEIEGAQEVAIELNSFSKMAGFTGIRLAWSVVPDALLFEDGTQVRKDWLRIATTFFNGASIIAQLGGLSVLEPQGLKESAKQTDFYLENAQLIKQTLQELGLKPYGGDHAPYLWVPFSGKKSWDVFSDLLEKTHILTTPGIGFGPAGEGFLRFSAFGHRENIEEALNRLRNFGF